VDVRAVASGSIGLGGAGAFVEALRPPAEYLLGEALKLESDRYLANLAARADTGAGRVRPEVVRNGLHPRRLVDTGLGPLAVRLPKLRSRSGRDITFRSMLVERYSRRTASMGGGAHHQFLEAIARPDARAALSAIVGADVVRAAQFDAVRLEQLWREHCRRMLDEALPEAAWSAGWLAAWPSLPEPAHAIVRSVVGVGEREAPRLLAVDWIEGSEPTWSCVRESLRRRGFHAPLQGGWDGRPLSRTPKLTVPGTARILTSPQSMADGRGEVR
jgi:hypothetical protein